MSSLWSDAIKPGIVSPYTILREQADALEGQTSGVLLGRVEKTFFERSEQYNGENKQVRILKLEIVVPALQNFRWGILRAAHNEMFPYPVFLDEYASDFKFQDFLETDHQTDRRFEKPSSRADTDDEFRVKVANILQSPNVVSTAVALIAKVSENNTFSENEG